MELMWNRRFLRFRSLRLLQASQQRYVGTEHLEVHNLCGP